MIATHDGHTHGAPAPGDMTAMTPSATMSPMPSESPMAGMSDAAPMDGMSGSMDMGSAGDSMDMGSMMSMSGPDLFPSWVMYLWIAALAAVLIFHCLHWVRMAGQHRWFHGAHILMIVGMIYMYAMMEFKLEWVSGPIWVWIYSLTTAAIVIWMIVRFVHKTPFSYLWIFALLQQAAMIYMWLPMSSWIPWFSYALAAYFALEAISWLVGYIGDTKPGRGFAFGPGDRVNVVALGHPRFVDNLSMAVMAASMSYMFVGMQLMV
ncbi:MAG: hypothetical protein HQ526_05660 [Actinobacteria bacterium]|nr:hypothetical protein [Actinomycetota bacterium]